VCEWYLSLVVRTAEAPGKIADAIRREIRAVDPDRAIYNVRAMDQAIAGSLAARRFVMTLVMLFAVAALVIGALGIYGVMAFAVTRRTREIGIRLALGALPKNVTALIVGQGMRLAMIGGGLGLLGFGLLSRLLARQLFGVTANDPLTLAGVSLLMLLTAGVACWLPARRAGRVDPMITLREGGE
jgi:putative ABC transport system permease protein